MKGMKDFLRIKDDDDDDEIEGERTVNDEGSSIGLRGYKI